MLPSKYRLRQEKEFQKVLHNGQKIYSPMMLVRYLTAVDGFKMGQIVSTKVAKKAHDRNRVKRLIREIVRTELLNKIKPVWMVIVARSDIIDKNYQQIKMELCGLLKKEV